MLEQWVSIKEFEGLYEVSNLGRVRSLTTKRNHGGYRPRPWVCHKDDDSSNDRASNLYWGTRKDNLLDRSLNGHSGKIVTNELVLRIKKAIRDNQHLYRQNKNGGLYGYIGRRFGVTRNLINNIVRGKTWKHVQLD